MPGHGPLGLEPHTAVSCHLERAGSGMTQMDDMVGGFGPGLAAAVVSPESSTGLHVPGIDEGLTCIPDRAPDVLVDTRPASISPRPSEFELGPECALPSDSRSSSDGESLSDFESDAGVDPSRTRRRSADLRARLFCVDAAVAGTAWMVLGCFSIFGTAPGRRWVSAIVATVVTLAAMQLLGLYRSRFRVQRGQEMARIVLAVLAGSVAFVLIRGNGGGVHRAVVVAAGFCVVALIIGRWIFGQWLFAQRARGRYLRGIVMIGTNDDAIEVLTMLRTQPELGYEVRAIIGEARPCPEWADLPNAQILEELPEIANRTHATGVLVLANTLSAAEVNRVISLSAVNNLHVQLCAGLRGLATRRVRSVPMSGEVFLYVEPARRPTWQLVAKRLVDVLGAAVGLLIAAPILLLAWVAIRLEDNGPAIYRQIRIGLNGRPFVVYKLRSMVLDADKVLDNLAVVNERTDGPLFKSVHDPRITRVGAVIRALSIDELPQLFNVLTGSMSLVGPRPALAHEVAQFDPELLRRHNVKQGITGLWQVEARDNPSFHAYRRLDLFYVDNWSIGLDLVILLATVPKLFAHALKMHRRPSGTAGETLSEV
jgi:exopolysaccharide biosynthesis polyprenyl glycosylphosphotransferase